ncbi:MAG: hypothetical protein AAB113_05865, partial [Candidatus Eisenbacteria bacterium]
AVLVAVGLVAGALAVFLARGWLAPPAQHIPLRKFELRLPDAGTSPRLGAISPDGRTAAYFIGDTLWVQDLGELKPRRLTVQPGARLVFWSPDGKQLGTVAGTRVTRVALAGGESQMVCDARASFSGGSGATWRDDGTIVFSRADSTGLSEVSALSGDPRTLLEIDPAAETDFHEPSALPGDRGLLFLAHRRKGSTNNICLLSRGKRNVLLELEGQRLAHPCYASSGHILYERAGTNPGIWALPFSLARLEVTGEPILVVPGGASPAVSDDGTLTYIGGASSAAAQLRWIGHDGRALGDIAPPRAGGRAPSPDGTHIAYVLTEPDNPNGDVWVQDVTRGTRTRLTFEPGAEGAVSWTPKGDRIVYQSRIPEQTSGPSFGWRVLSRAADGTGGVDSLSPGGLPSISPDGRYLAFSDFSGSGSWDLAYLALDGDRKPVTFLLGGSFLAGPRISPAGNFIAYMSEESGEWEVFLKRFPSGEGKWQVSTAGGQWPRWNGKGDRLYYGQGPDVMEVEVSGQASATLSTPKRLFTRSPVSAGIFGWYPAFDVTGDGERFVIVTDASTGGAAHGMTVVQNWVAEFQGKKAR